MARRMPAARQKAAIVEAAIAIAEERGWEQVRLHEVAERLSLALTDIHAQFRDLDAVANAWFDQALDATLAVPPSQIEERAPPERLEIVIMRWFEALATHKSVSGQMLSGKLYPSHPHHWVPMIFDLSRLIHWFLDAARIRSTGRRRQLAEIGLTLIFLATLRVWLRDDTPDLADTRHILARRLQAADRWLARAV